jgi:transcriptional regulator with XRE-family HTH domain
MSENYDLSTFSKLIINYRFRKQETVTDAAKALDVSRTYLSRLEHGFERPSLLMVQKFISHYSLSVMESTELLQLVGYRSGAVAAHEIPIKEDFPNMKTDFVNQPQAQPQINAAGFQVNLPGNTPVLYTDSAFATSNKWGLVLDFAQSMGPTNQQTIVARVGMSKAHAEALAQLILKKLEEEKNTTS